MVRAGIGVVGGRRDGSRMQLGRHVTGRPADEGSAQVPTIETSFPNQTVARTENVGLRLPKYLHSPIRAGVITANMTVGLMMPN